ncbi:MAG: MmgE/PrpD family protein [Dehalococcoidia bacterium]|nr:MmgE/PrpD family protein [Dehalococcoidia bacterium]
MDKMTDLLASYTTSLKFDELPANVVQQAKRMIVDALGCAIGGYHSEPARIARELASTVTSTRPATILVSGHSTSPDMAAFANGVMIRYLDFNDGYTGKEPCHPSDTLAAILSPAEIVHADGKTVLAATVLAYEVFCRLCDAASVRSRGFDHVTLGIIPSGLAAAKVMGLSQKQTAETVNLCIAPNQALFQTRIGDVSMWKGCAFANASRNAVFASLLAERGLTGPSPVFEGVGGFFTAVSGEPFTLEPFGDTGGPFKIMEATIKRFPLGLYSQTVVQAALEVRGSLSRVEDIAHVNVQTLQTAEDIMAGDDEKWHPANRETADHSMPYTVAVALMYGSVEEHHFGEEYLRNPQLLDLGQKVKVSVSEEANRRAPEAMLSTVEVVTTSGDRHSSPEVPYHRGHWKNPMTNQELEEKFRALARDILTPAQVDALLDRLWNLEQVDDIGQVIGMVRV